MNNAQASVVDFQALAADEGDAPFERLLAEQRGPLQNLLRRRLYNEDDVIDAVQETYLRLLDYRSRNPVDSPAALLFRIAENVANDFARRAGSHRASAHFPLDAVELPSVEPSQERQVAAEQELSLLVEGVESLPPKCQQVFLLSRVYELSYSQIAERCGISVKMVEKHISQALVSLRACVGGDPGAGA